MKRREREGAYPTPDSPGPIATAAKIAADWLMGIGFLRFHAAAFAIGGAILILLDLILSPTDPWALDLLRTWVIVLGSHAAALAAGWATWLAIRPHRLAESPLAWFLADSDDVAQPEAIVAAGPPPPLPATGRFTPGQGQLAHDSDDEPAGIARVVAILGDAVFDLADLARSGIQRVRSLVSRGLDWVRNEDAEDEDDEADAALTGAPVTHPAPTPFPPISRPVPIQPAPSTMTPLSPRPTESQTESRREVSGG